MAKLLIRSLVKTLSDGRRRFTVEVPAFSLAPGERRAIVGPTGSGKTTAMDILALASPPDYAREFTLSHDGRRIDLATAGSATLTRLRSRHFGYVLQASPLYPFLTLGENLSLGQRLAGRRDARFLRDLARRVGLTMAPGTRVADLSVGQRQRVAVVRALAHRPDFILCDEPTAALDAETGRELISTILEVAGKTGAAVLIITHQPALIADRGFAVHDMLVGPTEGRSYLVEREAVT